MKTFQKRLTRILALVLVLAIMLPFAACRKQQQDPGTEPTAAPGEMTTYTVQIRNVAGQPLSGVGVYIYQDATQAELVWFDQTDAEGKMTFSDLQRDTYVAVLADVPTGYAAEESYPITGELTQIVLQTAVMDEENSANVVYKLGDMVMDFTVTDAAGNTYTLSELLKQKKAVMLNFWYVECDPCKAEFPFLQEAYDQYSDLIEVLALNPVNTPEQVKAFQAESGYTFPMMTCGPEWEKLMGIKAYPTTVIIDRFGNICLIHEGSIDSAKIFTDVFAHFTAEDYQQTLVEDIMDLHTEEEKGSAENPNEVGGQAAFEITVEPGQEVYTDLYKAKGMYLSIYSEDGSYYVLYNGKKYTPESDNSLGFMVVTGDTYNPAQFCIGNESDKTQTYKVYLSHLPGTFNNPYQLKEGEFTVKVSAGNEQGVYYRCTAPEDGTYTIQCIQPPAGVDYDFFLQSLDLDRTILRNYTSDGSRDEISGYPTVKMEMRGGQGIMFCVNTLPNDDNVYPGGTFRFLLTFEPGELAEAEKAEMLDYTVTVKDTEGNPIPEVTVWFTDAEGKTVSDKTAATGVVTANLVKGDYTCKLAVPEGYTMEQESLQLTAEKPSATVTLKKESQSMLTYTVTVLDPDGAAIKDVEVLVIGASSAKTNSNGKAFFQLPPAGYTAMISAAPADYVCGDILNLTAEAPAGTLQLQYAPGTEQNPIQLTQLENRLTNEGTVYYSASFDRLTLEVTGCAGFAVKLGNKVLTESGGRVTCKLFAENAGEPVVFAIAGDGEYQVNFLYPVGHENNPDQLTLGVNTATMDAGDPNYHYTWTAPGDGELTITMDAAAQWSYSISNLTTGQAGNCYYSDDAVVKVTQTLTLQAGDRILLQVNTYDKEDAANTPAGTVSAIADFAWVVDADDLTQLQLEAEQTKQLKLLNGSRRIITLESANASVTYAGTTYTPDGEGKVTVLLGKEAAPVITVQNTGTAPVTVPVSFSWPEGSRQNPTILPFCDQSITTMLENGDDDGHYYAMIASKMGWLTFTKNSAQSEGDYTFSLQTNGGSAQTPAEGDDTKTVTLRIYPNDEILFHVIMQPDAEGNYVAAVIVNDCTFVLDTSIFTVTYDPNGGTLTGEATGCTVQGKLPEMASAPILDGYDFLGWFTAITGGEQVTTETGFAEDMTLYAQWAKICTVTFDANGGTLSGEATATTAGGKLGVLPAAPTRDGWEFAGWYNAATGGTRIYADTHISQDMTLYAHWTPIYTITLDGCGGTLTGGSTATTTDCKLPALPAAPSRAGWEFTGWFSAAAGGKAITTETVFAANTTIYAQWKRQEYTVTFNACGGTLTGDSQLTTVEGKLSSLPTPTRTGFIFLGWFTAANGGSAITTDKEYTGNATVYAQWKSNTILYEVAVIDGAGAPVTGNVVVTWLNTSGTPVSTKTINNASGTVSAALTPGSYTVTLTLSGTYASYKYNTAATAVSQTSPNLTIQIAPAISSSATETDYYTTGGAMVTKDVTLGATYVKLNSSQSNYAVINGTGYCFFRYLVTEAGKYAVSVSNGAPVSNWGTNEYFIQKQSMEEGVNTFEVELKEAYFPPDTHTLPLLFAVEVTSAYPDTILMVKDAGEAEYTYMDAPYTTYEGTQVPAVDYKDGKPVAITANIFKLETGGKSLAYVDMLTDKAVKGDDGYYHLNSKTGPILYVNLGSSAPYISLAEMVGAIGQYGTGFKKIFFNEDGTPMVDSEGNYKKEDYTPATIAYALHIDKTYGVYPLTDDLIYMIQNGGEYKGWYTPGSGAYLLEESTKEVDNSLLWMFAVCYLQ